jgi:predicted transcriptional regulator
MPDMRTAIEEALSKSKEEQMKNEELKSAINQWETERGAVENGVIATPESEPKKNLTRTIHTFIFSNPRCAFSDIVKHVQEEGFSVSSVSSLLTQMLNAELIERTSDRKYVSHKPYAPIGKAYKKKVQQRKQESKKIAREAKKAVEAGLASLKVTSLSTSSSPVAPAATTFDPDAMLASLSFPQVMALYKKIKLMIGEA